MADPDDRDDLHDDELEPDESPYQTVVTIEVAGLSLYTHLGVTPAEQVVGQRVIIDITLEVGEPDATLTDLIEDTVDYAQVCNTVALVAQQKNYATLERLCTVVADRLLALYEVEAVSVKASKPEPPIALTVEEISVTIWRER